MRALDIPVPWKTAAVAAALALAQAPVGAASFSAVYAFGDSLSDNGNLYAVTSAAYGVANALPQALDYWQGRFSNGRVAVEVMAEKLGRPLVDLAFGGAYTNADPTYSIPGGTFSTGLSAQISRYEAATGGTADANGLFFVWAGANDLRDALGVALAAPPADRPAILAQAVADVTTALAGSATRLYADGARHFLLPLLPDFGLTPEGQSYGPEGAALVSDFSTTFDAALLATYMGLPLSGASVSIFDTLSLQRDVYANPAAYGIGDVTTPCFSGYVGVAGTQCAAGFATTAMFWDKVHPTAVTHEVLGSAMAAQVPEPQTMLLMAAGVAVLFALNRRRRRLNPA